jgi:hypothetical protein
MKRLLSAVLLLLIALHSAPARVKGKVLNDTRIEITADVPGNYTLVYETSSGKPLSDYARICTINVDGTAYYEDFIGYNAAPASAKSIGIYDVEGKRQGSIRLSHLKVKSKSAPLYSFGVLTDVHLCVPGIHAESDYTKALDFFHSEGAEMVCICGDLCEYGTEEEFAVYKELTAKAKLPVYTTTGNHDCTKKGINPEVWKKYTGLPLVFEKSVEVNGETDHFLFLGMSCWNFKQAYLEEHIDWLEEKLEEYRGERCFVFTHLFFPDRAGNLNGIYPPKNWLRGSQHERLEGLCKKYVNTLWFSGHSHWEWQLQKYQDTANIHRDHEDGKATSGCAVHVPGCGCPITSDSTTRVNNPLSSEGALIQVYDNHVMLLGVDLKNGKYLPVATYQLVTP